MRYPVLRATLVLAAALGLVLGVALVGSPAASAQDHGATVIRTPEETCFLETSPGVLEEFTCNNLDVYTPNGKIRTTAHGDTAPPADGTADVNHGFPTGFPVCSSTVSASGETRFTCHLDS
jgi:hypothetical protein